MKKCVFVLEDDDDLRELFAILLEEEMFEVKTYPNVESFRSSLLDQKHPDLIIMDVRLPDGDGMEVCSQVKADEKTKSIPIIMVSAHRDFNQDREDCPAEDFISKPFDIYHLIEKVQQYT